MGNLDSGSLGEFRPQGWRRAPPILPGLPRRIQPRGKAFLIFIVILLTQIPTQHRYTDWGSLDLWITKIPYKAIQRLGNFKVRRPLGGRLSKDLMSLTFFLFLSLQAPSLEETQLKSSLRTNKFQPRHTPRPGSAIFTSTRNETLSGVNTDAALCATPSFCELHYAISKGAAIFFFFFFRWDLF